MQFISWIRMFKCLPKSKSYPDVALAVLVVDQLTSSLVWFQNCSKFTVACHVEAIICGQHQQPSAVSPADLFLCTGNTFWFVFTWMMKDMILRLASGTLNENEPIRKMFKLFDKVLCNLKWTLITLCWLFNCWKVNKLWHVKNWDKQDLTLGPFLQHGRRTSYYSFLFIFTQL